jgi:hypothetical protein
MNSQLVTWGLYALIVFGLAWLAVWIVRRYLVTRSRIAAYIVLSILGLLIFFLTVSTFFIDLHRILPLPLVIVAAAFALVQSKPLSTQSLLYSIAILAGLNSIVSAIYTNEIALMLGLGVTAVVLFLAERTLDRRPEGTDGR